MFGFNMAAAATTTAETLNRVTVLGLLFNRQFFERTRVARWFILRPKIPIWVHFGGPCNGKCWYNLWPFGKNHGRLV
jgi:hypothetical protein